MIRHATINDIGEILVMFKEEHDESGGACLGSIPFDAGMMASNLMDSLTNDRHILLVAEKEGELVGWIWGVIGRNVPWSTAMIATDRVVFVRRQVRGTFTGPALVKAYSKEAGRLGAEFVVASTAGGISDEANGELYKRLGFKKTGHQYMKEVGNGYC